MPRRLRGWLELLRAPNLLTVPGDPLAGVLLAQAAGAGDAPPWRMAGAAAVSLLLYAGGLIANDLLDFAEDLRDRPHRPLPSGRVARRSAVTACVAAFAAAMAAAAWLGTLTLALAGGLLACVLAYNGGLKRLAGVGPAAMGLCRALSLLLGAAAAGGPAALAQPAVLLAGGGLLVYIAAVTQLARHETRQRNLGLFRWAPTAVLAAWLVALGLLVRPAGGAMTLAYAMLAALAAGRAGGLALHLGPSPAPQRLQRAIGELIRGLMIVQAAMAALSPEPGAALAMALIGGYWLAGPLGRRFAGS